MVKILSLPYTFESYLGDSDVAFIVINESKAEGEEAKNFLEDVRVTFPEVCKLNCNRPNPIMLGLST